MADKGFRLENFERQSYEKHAMTFEYKESYGHRMQRPHWHPQYEVTFLLSGHFEVRNNMGRMDGDGPALLLHAPFSLHELYIPEDTFYRRYLLYTERETFLRYTTVNTDYEAITDANLVCVFPNGKEYDEFNALFGNIRDHTADERYCALMSALITHLMLGIAADGRGTVFRNRFSYIQDVLNFVSEHISERYSVEMLARRYSISTSKLNRDFREMIGTPYFSYMNTLRMTMAEKQLRAGGSIVRTAMECGYASEAAFIKAYRRFFGVTPGTTQNEGREKTAEEPVGASDP